jgi:hypothetical protein
MAERGCEHGRYGNRWATVSDRDQDGTWRSMLVVSRDAMNRLLSSNQKVTRLPRRGVHFKIFERQAECM